jgi:hypothetical protein
MSNMLKESRVVTDDGMFRMTELPDKTRIVESVWTEEEEEEEDKLPKPPMWRRRTCEYLAWELLKLHGIENPIVFAPRSNSQYNHHSTCEWSEEDNNWVIKLGMNATMYTQKVKPKVAASLWEWFSTNYDSVDFLYYMMYSVVCEAIAPAVAYAARRRVREEKRAQAVRIKANCNMLGMNAPKEVEYAIKRKPLEPYDFHVGLWLNQKESQVNAVKKAIIKNPHHINVLLKLLDSLDDEQPNPEAIRQWKIDGECEICGKKVSVTAPTKASVADRFPKTCWKKDCNGTVAKTSGTHQVRVPAAAFAQRKRKRSRS